MQHLARMLLLDDTGLNSAPDFARGGEFSASKRRVTRPFPSGWRTGKPLHTAGLREWINIPDIRDFSDDLNS